MKKIKCKPISLSIKKKAAWKRILPRETLKKMRKIAYKILKTKDYFNYFTPEKYQPVFISVQDLTSDEVLGITRENLFELPWVGYQGY